MTWHKTDHPSILWLCAWLELIQKRACQLLGVVILRQGYRGLWLIWGLNFWLTVFMLGCQGSRGYRCHFQEVFHYFSNACLLVVLTNDRTTRFPAFWTTRLLTDWLTDRCLRLASCSFNLNATGSLPKRLEESQSCLNTGVAFKQVIHKHAKMGVCYVLHKFCTCPPT